MEKRIEALESQMNDVKPALVALHKILHEAIQKIDSNFELLDNRLENMENRLGKIENRLGGLEKTSSEEFESVGGKLDQLHVEVQKIQKVSNYSEEYENLLRISR